MKENINAYKRKTFKKLSKHCYTVYSNNDFLNAVEDFHGKPLTHLTQPFIYPITVIFDINRDVEFLYSNIECQEVLKETNDDWSPNFEEKFCRLKYSGESPSSKYYRVIVTGNDDYFIHKDFDNESDACDMFFKLKNRKVLNKKDLINGLKFEVF